MITPTPSALVRRGLVRGFRCPISGVEFVTSGDSRSEREQLRQDQEQHTYAAMHAIDSKYGDKPHREVADYARLYLAMQQEQQA